ncbi:MAG: T9SS type A sorting domain-containing protein [Bacteroidetes bacterium]|nr:T9SS type A sorting domain-containing protein [Bacteroidota bacterium]
MGINATGMNVWTPYLYTPGLVGEFEEAKMEILFLAGPAEPITMNLLIDYLHSLDEFFNFKETIDDFGDPITGIVSQSGTQTPNVYALSQNYPNPFNPVTKIDFSIPKSGLVTLKVFDILGKEIATLVNEKLSAGKYETDFNASKLSSGTYYYRIETGDYVETKKMLLIK